METELGDFPSLIQRFDDEAGAVKVGAVMEVTPMPNSSLHLPVANGFEAGPIRERSGLGGLNTEIIHPDTSTVPFPAFKSALYLQEYGGEGISSYYLAEFVVLFVAVPVVEGVVYATEERIENKR